MRTNIPIKQGVAKGAMMLLLVLVGISMAWAQSAINDIPKEVKASDATITQMGHATLTLRQSIVVDSVSGRVDTLRKVTNVEWHTEPGTAKRRMAEQRDGGSGFYDHDSDWWLDLHWYTYNYPSVDEDGNYLLLSSMACMPDNDCRYVNNVIIACHVTLTDNDQCPSMYNTAGSAASDVSILMNHASSGLVIHSAQSDMPYYNLVILPDYEGFGIVLIEALDAGVPFVGTNVSGIKDIANYIAPKKSSILVDNNIDAIAKGIKYAMNGKVSKGFVFDLKKYNDEVINRFNELIKK